MSVFLYVLSAIIGYMMITAISFGSVLALVMSWTRNRSVLWAVFHGWCSWFYVIYYWMRSNWQYQDSST